MGHVVTDYGTNTLIREISLAPPPPNWGIGGRGLMGGNESQDHSEQKTGSLVAGLPVLPENSSEGI